MSRARCRVRQQVAIFNCERQVMDVPVPGACKALKIPSPPRRCSGDDRLGNGDFDGRVQARRPAGRLALDSAVAIRSPRGSISVSNTRSAGAGQPVTDAIFPNARIGTLLRLAWINVANGADPGWTGSRARFLLQEATLPSECRATTAADRCATFFFRRSLRC